ncbi:MAG TPA: hypothetical protein VGA47_10765 [Candidatus Dormibacteraeota bacterium]
MRRLLELKPLGRATQRTLEVRDTLAAVATFGFLMSTVVKAAALVIVVALVAGCGSVLQPGANSVGKITLTVSGGIAGWERTLTVEPEGKAHVQVVRGPSPAAVDKEVDRAVLTKLHELVSDPAFAGLERQYLPSPGGADLQDYVVTAQVGDRTITTMSRDGANPPAILRDVLTILNGILASSTSG